MGTMTTISLSMETKNKLKTYGNKGESFDMILNKLMSIEDDSLLRELLFEDTNFVTLEDARKYLKESD